MAPKSRGTQPALSRAKVTTPRAMLVARNAPRPRYSCDNACWPIRARVVARPRSSKSIVSFLSSGCSARVSFSNSGSISRTRSTMRTRRFVVVRINELVARIITAGVIIDERTLTVDSRFGRENISRGPGLCPACLREAVHRRSGNIRGAAVTQVSSAPPPAERQPRSRRSAPESFVPANSEGL